MAANCTQPENFQIVFAGILSKPVVQEKVGFPRRRGPDSLSRRRDQVKTAWKTDPLVVALENWQHILNRVTDVIVVRDETLPIDDRAIAKSSARHAGDNGRLAKQMFRGGAVSGGGAAEPYTPNPSRG